MVVNIQESSLSDWNVRLLSHHLRTYPLQLSQETKHVNDKIKIDIVLFVSFPQVNARQIFFFCCEQNPLQSKRCVKEHQRIREPKAVSYNTSQISVLILLFFVYGSSTAFVVGYSKSDFDPENNKICRVVVI